MKLHSSGDKVTISANGDYFTLVDLTELESLVARQINMLKRLKQKFGNDDRITKSQEKADALRGEISLSRGALNAFRDRTGRPEIGLLWGEGDSKVYICD